MPFSIAAAPIYRENYFDKIKNLYFLGRVIKRKRKYFLESLFKSRKQEKFVPLADEIKF